MEISFHKISDNEHSVSVLRPDGSRDVKKLNSRGFLFHDLAHLVLETQLPLANGFWGSVAQGARLDGSDCHGEDVMLAESLAGPLQVLIKRDAPAAEYLEVLERVLTDRRGLLELAARIHEQARKLKGQWRATHFGDAMTLTWP